MMQMMIDELGLVIVDTINDINIKSPALVDRTADRLHALDTMSIMLHGAQKDIVGMVAPCLRVHHGL